MDASGTGGARAGLSGPQMMETNMKRRKFIKLGTLALAATAQGCGSAALPAGKLSIAGAFDREMEAFMQARKIPGGALAVVKDRRLVYARGYGWADREKMIPVQPASLFRIASVSKPITAVAVLKLIEDDYGKRVDTFVCVQKGAQLRVFDGAGNGYYVLMFPSSCKYIQL